MHVFYGSAGTATPYRYQCRGDDQGVRYGHCIGIGGGRVDKAISAQILDAVSPHALDAALLAAEQSGRADLEVQGALERQLEEARYGATLAERRYEAVDPDKRHVARELEARWNAALEKVAEIEQRIDRHMREAACKPALDRTALDQLARHLPSVWNDPATDPGTRQRLVHILIREVVVDLDDAADETVLIIYWTGGRHTEVRVKRAKSGRYPVTDGPGAVEVMRKLGGHWPDRQLAVTLNRMRCKTGDGGAWTTVHVRDLRDRLGIAEYDPASEPVPMISIDATAKRLGICIGSVSKLIREGILPATQLMYAAPWKIPADALESEAVRIGVQQIKARRPRKFAGSCESPILIPPMT
jgi:hypothetical protein